MVEQIAVGREALALRFAQEASWMLRADLAYKRLDIVNIAFVGTSESWALIGAGLRGTARLIRHAARKLFGERKPDAILLAHGHFDDVGALKALLSHWGVPVYAHQKERPFLDGSKAYPPPDPGSDTGLMPLLSPLFPRSPIDVGGTWKPYRATAVFRI